MPDGTTPPPTPEQQAAQQKMYDWMQQHQDGGPGGIFGIGTTVTNLVAAAGAGQVAIAPDAGKAIIDQLTKVQDAVETMKQDVLRVAYRAPLGGGFAEQVSQFNQQLADGGPNSAKDVLTKFGQEIEALKLAVQASIENYGATDTGSAGRINSAGGTT